MGWTSNFNSPAILLLVVAAGLGFWLMEKSKTGFKYALAALFGFLGIAYSLIYPGK
jgi:hypothetical protein